MTDLRNQRSRQKNTRCTGTSERVTVTPEDRKGRVLGKRRIKLKLYEMHQI